jgi:hypothetical protein
MGMPTTQIWSLEILGVNIGVSSHCYPCFMPCEIRVEVVQGIDFLQVVNP